MADRVVRVRVFSSAKAEEWIIWRHYFERLARMWQWNAQRAKDELATAMDGDAARATNDLDIDAATLNEALTLYEERFITAAGAELAETEFHNARQTPDEAILQYHARCRELFRRAYPGEAVEGQGLARMLRKTFIWGLNDQRISEYVWDRRPGTYAECLQHAQEKLSTLQVGVERRKLHKGLHALPAPTETRQERNPPPQAANLCHGCGQPGHFIRQCPAIRKAKELGIVAAVQPKKKKTRPATKAARKTSRPHTKVRVNALGNDCREDESSATTGYDHEYPAYDISMAAGNLQALSL